MYEQYSSWVTSLFVIRHPDSASRQVQLFISSVILRATSLLHLLYFSTYRGIKTLFLILNIGYEQTTLV